jgi:iron complex transport system ATP-binding protein
MSTDIIIIAGKINSGKTTACKTYIRHQRDAGKSVGGTLSVPVWRKGKKTSYYAYDISTQESILLASEAPVSPSVSHGRFHFPLRGFAFAEKVLLEAAGLGNSAPKEIILIDEIGPLELKEEGFAPVLRRLLFEYSGTLLLVVRESHLSQACGHFGIECPGEKIFTPHEEISA